MQCALGALSIDHTFIANRADTLSSDIRKRLEATFREVFDDDALTLTVGFTRDDLEAWDSLGHIRLISAIEEDFGLTLTLEEIELMTSVATIESTLAARG